MLLLGTGAAADAKRRLIEDAGGIPVSEAAAGARIAFVALEDGAEAAAARLREQGLLVNVVDRPELCDFTVPAIVDRSPVLVAIGTGGASASLAKALKERLELLLPKGLGRLAEAIRAARASAGRSPAERRSFWAALLAPGAALDPLREQDDPAAAIAAGPAAQAPYRVERIAVPEDMGALTLRNVRLLQQADLLVAPPGVSGEVLALARRDAARAAAVPDPPPPGLTVILLPSGARAKS